MGTYYLLYNAQCYAELNYRVDFVSCAVGIDTHTGILGCDWKALKKEQQTWGNRTLLKTGDSVSGFTCMLQAAWMSARISTRLCFMVTSISNGSNQIIPATYTVNVPCMRVRLILSTRVFALSSSSESSCWPCRDVANSNMPGTHT